MSLGARVHGTLLGVALGPWLFAWGTLALQHGQQRTDALERVAYELRHVVDTVLEGAPALAGAPGELADALRVELEPLGDDPHGPRRYTLRVDRGPGRALRADERVVRVLGAPAAPDARLVVVAGQLVPDFPHGAWAFAGLVLAVAALLLGRGLVAALAEPLAAIERAAERVRGGDPETGLTVGLGGEAGRTLASFDGMVRELRRTERRLLRAERVAAWRDIAQRIAHEIKNPLLPIQVSMETLRKTHAQRHEDFAAILEESTTTVLEEVERLRRIVTEFSEFARLPRPNPTRVRLGEVLDHVAGLVGPGVEVTGDAALHLRADRDHLVHIFMNLAKNAVEASGAAHGDRGPRVAMHIEPAPDGVRVHVDDDGAGIPEAERERVFDPYYTTKAGGTGLGLPIVLRMVEEHRGHVDIERSPWGGARVTVFLPTAGPATDAGTTVS